MVVEVPQAAMAVLVAVLALMVAHQHLLPQQALLAVAVVKTQALLTMEQVVAVVLVVLVQQAQPQL
jgi:hypothetical protein